MLLSGGRAEPDTLFFSTGSGRTYSEVVTLGNHIWNCPYSSLSTKSRVDGVGMGTLKQEIISGNAVSSKVKRLFGVELIA